MKAVLLQKETHIFLFVAVLQCAVICFFVLCQHSLIVLIFEERAGEPNLQMLESAASLASLKNLPGDRLEALSGDHMGQQRIPMTGR